MKRRSKYNADKTTVDGITFASKAEAKRYGELRLLERAGEIATLVLQPTYWLSVHSGEGKFVKIGEYRADFEYWDKRTKQRVTEDTKGYRTPLYKWKKRHVEAQHGIKVIET